MTAGIYTITSPSGGQYVGSAVDFKQRVAVHRSRLKSRTHHSAKLQNAADKYGIDSLVFSRIIVCSVDNLLMYEQAAIDALSPRYNIAPKAGHTLGYRHTDETKAKFPLRKRATPNREAISAATKGRKCTDEHKAKVALANLGARRSDAARAAMSAAATGKKQSVETIEKRAASLRGKPRPAHVIEAMRLAHIGRKPSPEQILKCKATWAAKRNEAA